jgi:diguanylate cyclase (GGDEF)-like protein
MNNAPSSFFHPNRISRKLLRVVFVLYLVLTITMTIFQFSAEYVRTKKALLDELYLLCENIAAPISTNLWQLNTQQLATLANGLVKMPIVQGVDIVDVKNQPIIKLRTYSDNSEPLSLFSVDQHLSWTVNNQAVPLGNLRLYSSSNVIFDRLVFSFTLIFINAIIKTIVLWYLFLWAFKRFLGAPLQRLIAQVDNIHLENISKQRIDLKITDYNELRVLQEKINTMLAAIENDRQLMVINEEERLALLETEVSSRTQELVNLNIKLSQMALTDELTNIHNRRSFFEKAQNLTDLAVRQGAPLCLLTLDIDFFKKINDHFGHGVGDQALCHFSQLISANLRKVDLFARVGGEEFAILLMDTNQQGAVLLAEKLCKFIRETPLQVEQHSLNMSVSIGVIERQENETQVTQFFKRGDDLLYQAKHNGRNRVES